MKNNAIKISKELSFPIDVVTQTLSTIGRKGAGKTYLATMIAEQMIDIGAQVVAIDPVGNWWGLRVGADGKSRGKEIFVIGGDHGDVPLVPEAGAKIAKLIVEKTISAVLDISGFRLGERKRFCTDFGEELLHLKKKQRTPVHVFIEEAQLLIPQRVGHEEARMVGAFEQIVRLGRNYGIGCTLVTQRPQSVNKEVLSQVECLCVLQVTGPHERKALEDWVQEAGADRKLIGELPGLSMGEGYVWSPSWLRIYQRVHFAKKETFDASATPEVGQAAKAARLASIDVERLKADMTDIISQAEKDDPAALRRKIALLQKELTAKQRSNTGEPAVKIERIEIPVLKDKQIKRLETVFFLMVKESERHGKAMNLLWGNFNEVGDALLKALEAIKRFGEAGTNVPRLASRIPNPAESVRFRQVPPKDTIPKLPVKIHHPQNTMPEMEGELTGPEQRILDAIAWMESIGIYEPNQTAVAFFAGYKYGGGAFNNPRGSLRMKGLVEYRGSERMALTDAGRQQANIPETPLTTEELHRKVLERLPGPERKIMSVLLEIYPNEISNEELAQRAGYAPNGGAYNNPRGRLRSLGLIEYKNSHVVARDILFLET